MTNIQFDQHNMDDTELTVSLSQKGGHPTHFFKHLGQPVTQKVAIHFTTADGHPPTSSNTLDSQSVTRGLSNASAASKHGTMDP